MEKLMNQINSVCVYSASSTKIDPVYFTAAETLGRLLADHHIRLINGAGSIGLMRSVADAVLANELKIGHVKVSSFYALLQLVISLGFVYLCPDTVVAHWIYLISAIIVLALIYVLFKKKYYHLHEEYLASLKNGQ